MPLTQTIPNNSPYYDQSTNNFDNETNRIKIIDEELIGNIKDKIVTSDGQFLFPCRYCNKVFSMRKTRTEHIVTCPAKSYILSVNDSESYKKQQKQRNVENNNFQERRNDGIGIKENMSNDNSTNTQKLINEAFHLLPEINITIVNKKEKRMANCEELITCEICNLLFNSSVELLKHRRKEHRYPKIILTLDEIKKYYNIKDRSKCPICTKPLNFKTRSALIKHLHTHTDLRNYSCDICNKKFRRKDHLTFHAKRHI